MTASRAITAPIDAYADERPFAHVTRSGRMSYSSEPNHVAEAAEARDDLVRAQEDAVAVAELPDARQ